MMAEMSGNIPVASQWYDQAIGLIGNSIGMARQSGIPVTEQVFFAFAQCSFNAARIKTMMGWVPAAANHLAQALEALNQAIAINPGLFQLHSAAGTVMMAQWNLPWAGKAFQRALQLNPQDPWSQYMLNVLHSMRGQAAQSFPAVPQVPAPSSGWAAAAPAPAKHDWVEIFNNGLKALNNVCDIFGKIQSAGDQGPSPYFG